MPDLIGAGSEAVEPVRASSWSVYKVSKDRDIESYLERLESNGLAIVSVTLNNDQWVIAGRRKT